ncbi:hypothetical protein K493DRAFT_345838 [Basidiobolus meristosporus CBS 931.73]|uniref:Tim44-like domain-containing protein n=1 Tax=Basidiobolus meristosporus CBS 931.73 TaxID=1314790 RepID=A0A1Y1Z1C9_9FUNG|nr:hypothetical protein K493DRAFT_345838 [Basidiobolus meristosporus CBS 931.73]|eukprot:ORY04090.1 hypothetical protein K493DRAFT_345838 [Basidiobolus meristosporus CBS 931.73]
MLSSLSSANVWRRGVRIHPNIARRLVLAPVVKNASAQIIPSRYFSAKGSENPEPSTFDGTEEPVKFPWLYGEQPPRIGTPKYNMHPRVKNFPLAEYIVPPIARWHCGSKLQSYTSPDYFPDQFLIGAALATKEICRNISSSNLPYLKDNMSHQLYERYAAELENLSKRNASVNIDFVRLYDGLVKDIWVIEGPQKALTDTKNYVRRQTCTYTLAYHKKGLDSESFAKYVEFIAKESDKGIFFKVDVEVDADIHFQLSQNETTIVDNKARRSIIMSFETEYYEPANKLAVAWNDGTLAWKVSDIDRLLEYEEANKPTKPAEPSDPPTSD